MKIEKNKIVFVSVIIMVIIFIVAYSTLVLMGEEESSDNLKQPSVPVLQEEKENYTSKMNALDDLKEERQSNAPSIYSDKLLDSLGIFDPALEEKEKERAIDSIYDWGRINYEERGYREEFHEPLPMEESLEETVAEEIIPVAEEFSLQHQVFFRAVPFKVSVPENTSNTGKKIIAKVNGEQQIRINDRLELILVNDVVIGGEVFPGKILLYGFVSFQPNRVLLEITHINHREVKLKAFDFQDGGEGFYVENSFRSEATKEVLDDVVQDINIAGLPQVGGIKNIFRRNNRNIKVTISDQYQLILKPGL